MDELTSSEGRRSSSSAGSALIASRQSTPSPFPVPTPAARTASLQIRSILSRSQNPITARFPLCMITLLNSFGTPSLPCAIVCAWAEPPSVSSVICGTAPTTPSPFHSSALQDCSGDHTSRIRVDLQPPADSPARVTFPGSPPNPAMCAWTHSSASTWSWRPKLPCWTVSSAGSWAVSEMFWHGAPRPDRQKRTAPRGGGGGGGGRKGGIEWERWGRMERWGRTVERWNGDEGSVPGVLTIGERKPNGPSR